MTIPVNPMPQATRLYTNITPFTVRDNATYLIVLEELRQFVNNKLVPFINDNVSSLDSAWVEQTQELIESWNTQSNELLSQVQSIANSLENEVQEAVDARDAAVAARNLAEQFASDAEEIQDSAIAQIGGNLSSLTRQLFDGVYASISSVDNISDILETGRLSETQLNATVVEGAEVPLPGFSGYLQTISALRAGAPVSVLAAIPDAQKSAILDGTTAYDATAAIQDMMDDDGAAENAHIVYPRGVFRHGNIQVRDKSTFKLLGQGARVVLDGDGSGINGVGFEVVGTVDDLEVAGFHVVGDGDKTHKHAGVWGNSGATLRDVRVHHMLIEDVVVGVSLNANMGGSIDGFAVTDNVLKDIVGIASGQGYGIHVAYENAGSARGIIARNRIVRAGRHSIYIARCSDVDVIDNMIVGHRSALTVAEKADAMDGQGKTRAGMNIARSRHVRVAGNWFMDGYDCAVSIIPNPDAEPGVILYDIVLDGNHFERPKDSVPMLIVGGSNADVTGVPTDVTVKGNDFYADFSTLPGVNSIAAIQHNVGKGITYEDNSVVIHGVNLATEALSVFNRLDNLAGNTYNDDLIITGTKARLTTNNASTCRVMRLDGSLLTSSAKVTVTNNEGMGDCINDPAPLVATPTNTKLRIRTRDGGCVGLYEAGDTTPSVSRGVTYMPIANASATSITNLDDGVDGQRVTLTFGDANTTLISPSATFRLEGGVDYVSANRRTITLEYRLGEWRECSRSNN